MPDQSDALASKVITGDAQEDLPAPGEAPVAATEFGVTAEEQRAGEPLDDRLVREVPDVAPEGSADGPYPEDRDERVGRFAEVADDATGKQQDVWAENVGTDRGGFAPEERAMHVDR